MLQRLAKHVVKQTGLRRHHVAAARMCCERHLMARFAPTYRRKTGRILCYHGVGQSAWGVNNVSAARFRHHLETALRLGFRFVPAAQIAADDSDDKMLAITFDDGLKSVHSQAAPILRDLAIPFSIFPVSEWSDNRHAFPDDTVLTWREIEDLLNWGAELGSHSATHADFGQLDRETMLDELGRSRDTFSARLGFAPKSFAIPLGQSRNWNEMAQDAAREIGYEQIYAQAETTRPAQTIARSFVTQFDHEAIFKALLKGKYDSWEEWV